jgi:hypothetical protein
MKTYRTFMSMYFLLQTSDNKLNAIVRQCFICVEYGKGALKHTQILQKKLFILFILKESKNIMTNIAKIQQ